MIRITLTKDQVKEVLTQLIDYNPNPIILAAGDLSPRKKTKYPNRRKHRKVKRDKLRDDVELVLTSTAIPMTIKQMMEELKKIRTDEPPHGTVHNKVVSLARHGKVIKAGRRGKQHFFKIAA